MLSRFLTLAALIVSTYVFSEEAQENKGTHRIFQFENEYVRVWRTVIMPNQPLKLHRHDCARVCVGLKGGPLTRLEPTGETSILPCEPGKALWLTEDPAGGGYHYDLNETDEPIEVMIIEIKALDGRSSNSPFEQQS